MGTLGCVPAYDRYFIAGIKIRKLQQEIIILIRLCSLLSFMKGILKGWNLLEEKMEVEGMPYPQMKMLDMGFWQVGFDLDTTKE